MEKAYSMKTPAKPKDLLHYLVFTFRDGENRARPPQKTVHRHRKCETAALPRILFYEIKVKNYIYNCNTHAKKINLHRDPQREE